MIGAMRPSPSAGEEAVLRELDSAFDRIEQTVLPTIAAVLDAVIDSAAGARPGIDADAYAEALRKLAEEVDAAQAAFSAMLADSADSAPIRPAKDAWPIVQRRLISKIHQTDARRLSAVCADSATPRHRLTLIDLSTAGFTARHLRNYMAGAAPWGLPTARQLLLNDPLEVP